MPETKLKNSQLPTTISSKTVDNTNDINTTTTRLKITGGSSGQVLSTDGAGNLSWKSDSVTDGDKGDITVALGGTSWTIDNSAVTSSKIANLAVGTAQIANDAVTYAKIQNVTASRLLGRATAGAGDAEEITLGTNLSFSGTTLNAASGGVTDGDKGDITVSASGATWTIDNDAVTYAKIQNVTTNRLLGRVTAGTGDVEEITIGSGLGVSGTTLSSLGAPTAVVTKSTDETVTSSTTFQTDDELKYLLSANRMYWIEYLLFVKRANTSASPVIKFSVDASSRGAGDFFERTTITLWDGVTALNNNITLNANWNIAGRVMISGTVIPNVQNFCTLLFAQGASSATGVTVMKNSRMIIWDLGAA